MKPDPIPDDIRRFILAHIPSVPHLEALLLLREDTARAWNGDTVAQRLYIAPPTAHALLAELHASGLLQQANDDGAWYRFAPGDDDLRDIVGRLADHYARNLVGVSTLIHSTVSKRARQFSNAFKLRGDS